MIQSNKIESMIGRYDMTAIPKYKILAETLRSDIVCGVYQNGDTLPSENELAEKYRLSRHTVRQAISQLEAESLIVRVRGSGTYVSYRKNRAPRTMTVGVITTYISDYIFPTILSGIEKTLSEKGYSMNLSATRNRTENEKRILHEYLEKPIDGLIVEGTKSALPNPNIALYEKLGASGVPIVFINSYYRELDAPISVLMEDREGGRQAVRYLIDRGYRNIGGIFKSDDMQGAERYAGYSRALTDADLPIHDEAVVWYTTESRQMILEQTEEIIMERLCDCDAVLCYNDEVAAKLIDILARRKISVPDGMAVMSFDDSGIAKFVVPPLTSLLHAKKEMGAIAAKKLLQMMAGKKESPVLLPWKISIRKST